MWAETWIKSSLATMTLNNRFALWIQSLSRKQRAEESGKQKKVEVKEFAHHSL